MRFVIFTHSLISDWNHGNAHFLRGFATELQTRGHDVAIFEPANGWSVQHLLHSEGESALSAFSEYYPQLRSMFYNDCSLDLDAALRDADVVIVHEWNSHELVARIGQHHIKHSDYQLFFHDTHHRSVTDPSSIANYDLRNYDGVLAFGAAIRGAYRASGWARDVRIWHEAADVRMFRPLEQDDKDGDIVWIGNWGDNERAESIREFLIEPVKRLGLRAHVYGVRYPDEALRELESAQIEYRGWLPNYKVPETFSRYRMTVHLPRGPYVAALPGIPTIRVFEALACGIPLISAPWNDCEHLFRPGDFMFARTGEEMTKCMSRMLGDTQARRRMIMAGLETIQQRHTCAHRVDELMAIVRDATPLSMAMES